MSRSHGPQALREKKSSNAKSRTQTRITPKPIPKPIPKPKTMRTKQTQNHYPLGAWKRTWSGSLNDRGMVGGERLQFSAGGKVRLNRARTITPPWERAAPAALLRSHQGGFFPRALQLLLNLFFASRVWAQLGLRAPRGQKSFAPSEAAISSRPWRFGASNHFTNY